MTNNINFKEIKTAISAYDKLTPAEVQEAITPIIKACDKKALSEYLGITVHSIYQYCRKVYVDNNCKPEFTTYAKLMALDAGELSPTAWMDEVVSALSEEANHSAMISFKAIANKCGHKTITIKNTKEIMSRFLVENPGFTAIQTMTTESTSLFECLHFMRTTTNTTTTDTIEEEEMA